MSWSWYSQLTDSFKRRAGRYLINRYLGPFLEEGILLDQLSIDEGIRLRNVALNTDHINSMLEDTEAPIEFVDGFIQELVVSVPWSNLLSDHCFFEIRGLTVTCQVKKRAHPSQLSASIFHSMCESFSSKDMAEECLRQKDLIDTNQVKEEIPTASPSLDEPVLGVEVLAQAIDSIITRVQVAFIDTTFRLEYVPTIAPRGLALEIKVGSLKYQGEAIGQDDLQPAQMTSSTLKKIFFEDVTLRTDEFTFHKNSAEVMTRSSVGSHEDEAEESLEDDLKPLILASLPGKQELVLRFVDTDHFGLPRSVEEVEFNLGPCLVHAFPHQIHTLIEIMSAFSNPEAMSDNLFSKESEFMQNPNVRFGLESMLQESMYHQGQSTQRSLMEGRWSTGLGSSGIDVSTEFQPMPKVKSSDSSKLAVSVAASDKTETPTIKVKALSLIAILLEKDEGVAKLGGESDKKLGFGKMHQMASDFFARFEPPSVTGVWDGPRQAFFHAKVQEVCSSSRLQLIGAPLSIVYEEQNLGFLMRLVLSVGRMSVKEVIVSPEYAAFPSCDVDVIKFTNSSTSDFKLIYEELPNDQMMPKTKTSIKINLNPCALTFDPGFVDRTYMIFMYSEMDPSCLVTPAINLLHEEEEQLCPSLNMAVACPQLDVNFYVPKVDMRKPTEIPTDEFVTLFWSRKIHPELFQLRIRQFDMQLGQDAGPKSPLSISLSSDFIDVLFQESEACDKLPLAVIRKSKHNAELAHKLAARISLTICMDDSQKLQGKFDSTSDKRFGFGTDQDQFFGHAAGVSGDTRSGFKRGNRIVEEQLNIRAALTHSLAHNNILIDINFDEVSLVLPNKHVYEVIYNRLGNDMLLWLPAIFSVKDVLYNQPLPDPLRDPDQEFSSCASGSKPMLEHVQDPDSMQRSIYDSFPKTNPQHPAAILIHTDTCVSLSLNRGHVTIAEADNDNETYFFVGIIEKLKLLTAVGLERDPEMCLLSLAVKDAKLYFGPSLGVHDSTSHDFTAKLHFNEFPSPKVMPLFRSTTFKTRVWPSSMDDMDLLQLTTKILFDSKTNFKTITLGLALTEGSVVASSADIQPILIDWLKDYFTVVEYPVLGYIPPAILTEMHFDVKHCTFDVTYLAPGQISLTLGHVKVTCCLVDPGTDVNINISAEDVGLFISKNDTAVSHVKSAICILDVDSSDLAINLREKPPSNSILDVSVAVQLLRIRTCSDTLLLLAALVASHPISSNASRESSTQKELSPDVYEQQQVPDDVVPDLADAMAELEMQEAKSSAHEESKEVKATKKSKMAKTKSGAQVFFFPDENQKIQALEQMGMTESIYVQQVVHHDDNEEDFCILDDIGSGFGSKPAQASVKILDPSGTVTMFENHFSMAKERANVAIDYLKTPKGFPNFTSRITLKNLSVLWQIYGGQDFSPVIQGQVSSSSEPWPNSCEGLKCRGGQDRQSKKLLEVFLSKISAQHELYPESGREASRQILIIKNFEIRDKLENSDINKLLHLYSNKLRPRQSNANMFSIKCINLRPDPDMPSAEETVVNVNLQPLRVNIDQETLFFIIEFSTAFLPKTSSDNAIYPSSSASGEKVHYSQAMETIEIQPDEMAAEAIEATEHEETLEEFNLQPASVAATSTRKEGDVYIRSFTFARDVPIRIDYSAKFVDLAHGAIPGILAGLTSLNCSELTLKKVHYRNGISGLDKLIMLLVTDWLADIRQNQIPAILGGVGPMHSFLQLAQGIKDLFLMPVEQYQKDGRLLRGLQKGAHSFTSLTAMSLLDFTNKLLGVIKFAAEMAFDIMSPEASVVQGKLPHPNINRNAIRRPADMREGMFNALAVIQDGMEQTARTVIENVIEDHRRRGLTGAVGGILRQVPSNMVRPVILATAATSNVLEGVKNQVAPDARIEEEDKWKNNAQNNA